MMATVKLYQFPISHYCEKVRWALAYKNVEHDIVNLLPGLHVKKTLKMTGKSSVPVLSHGGQNISGSGVILNYLEKTFDQPALMPNDQELCDQILRWEDFADQDIGVHVRRACYHTLLEYPDIVIPFFTANGPWYGRLLLKQGFPGLRARMRKFMDINQESCQKSLGMLDEAVQRVESSIQDNGFLVGEAFSRADLTVAALLAPLCMPKHYGIAYDGELPRDLQTLRDRYSSILSWVERIYWEYRPAR